jgi:hypothetical protein
MDAPPTGEPIEAVNEPIVNEVEKPTEERVIVATRTTQTEKRVSQKQLDALAKGRALNIERRRKYIEFEKLQKLQALQPPPQPVVATKAPNNGYKLSFV